MNNVDRSDGQRVHYFTEDDKTDRKACVSLFTMPLQMGKKNLDVCYMPDAKICQHWGVWAEFEQTSKGRGRCVYIIDADVSKDTDAVKSKNSYLSGIGQSLKTLANFTVGEFDVRVVAFYPETENGKHPYEKHMTKMGTDEDRVNGEISPFQLLETSRKCATMYESKCYNFVFNNCQTFANHLLEEIKKSMKNIAQTTSGSAPRTSGDVAITAGAAVATVGLFAWAATKVLASLRQNEEDEESDEENNLRA